MRPIQNGRGGRRRWTPEQKLTGLQEWKTGVPLEEVCRKYAVNAAQMARWKRSLDQGLKESGEVVPKSQVVGLQKRGEDLERALGRQAWEVEVVQKAFEFKGLTLPKGTERGWRERRDAPWRWCVEPSARLGVGWTLGGGSGGGGRRWRRRSASSWG